MKIRSMNDNYAAITIHIIGLSHTHSLCVINCTGGRNSVAVGL